MSFKKFMRNYTRLNKLENSEWPLILEDIVGNLYGFGETADTYAYDYQFYYTQLYRATNRDFIDIIADIINNRYKDNYDYWGNKEVEKSTDEIHLEQMQAQMDEWTSMQRRNNG